MVENVVVETTLSECKTDVLAVVTNSPFISKYKELHYKELFMSRQDA